MRSALLEDLDALVEVAKAAAPAVDPDLLECRGGGGHAHDANVERVNAHPQHHDEPGQNHNQGAQNPNGVTHPARLPPDPIARPAHYTHGGIETIDAIEAWGLGFHLGNVVKYVSRAGHKGDAIEDLRKARWYLDREIQRRESEASDLSGLAAREAL